MLILNSTQTLLENWRIEDTSQIILWANIALKPKSDNVTREQNYRLISFININAKVKTKIKVNKDNPTLYKKDNTS